MGGGVTTSISKNTIHCGLLYNIKNIKKKSFAQKFIMFIKKKSYNFQESVKSANNLGRGEVFQYILSYFPGASLLSIQGVKGDNFVQTWLNKTVAPGEYNLEYAKI